MPKFSKCVFFSQIKEHGVPQLSKLLKVFMNFDELAAKMLFLRKRFFTLTLFKSPHYVHFRFFVNFSRKISNFLFRKIWGLVPVQFGFTSGRNWNSIPITE